MDSRKIRLIMEMRRSGVHDRRIIAAIEQTPREIFVPDAFRDRAYEMTALPIGCSQTVTDPLEIARTVQALAPQSNSKMLEIGTGSGYQASILARVCKRIYTIERFRSLLAEAEKRFTEQKLFNVISQVGDGARGWPEQAPFDRIVVSAAAEDIPPLLADQLATGGVMLVPVGDTPVDQRMIRVTRTETGFDSEELWPTRFVPLTEGTAP